MHRASATSRYRLVNLLLPVAIFALLLAGFAEMNVARAASSAGNSLSARVPKGIRPHVFKTQQAALHGHGHRSQSDALLYNGGPVMQSGSVNYAIFWEPPTLQDGESTGVSATYNSLLERYFSDSGGSSLYGTATQYYDAFTGHIVNNSSFGGAWVDTAPYPASDCTDSATPGGCLTDAQIEAEVTQAMSVNGWTGGMNHMFFVFTSDGEGSCFDSSNNACSFTYYCAYHSVFSDNNNNPVIYANMPYTGTNLSACGVSTSPNNDFDADSTINVTSHEQMEAVTDPLLNAWYDSQGNEIGDKCAWNFGDVSLDNGQANEQWNQHYYITQQEWSNALNGCTQGEQGDQLVGTLYTGAKDGTLYAINTSDSSLRWRYRIATHKSITTPPVISNDVVYFGASDGYIYAVNATSGAFLWRAKTGKAVESAPAIVNGVLYAGSDDDYLYALNAATGAQLWKYQTHGAITATPLVADTSVYVGSGDGYLYALNSGGTLLWKYHEHGPIGGMAVAGSSAIYSGSRDGYLYALNASNGKLLWQYRFGITGAYTASGGILYVGAHNGYLYALNLSTHTLAWTYKVGSAIQSAPLVANNAIYSATATGYLYALKLSNHTLLWKSRISAGISGSPAAIDVAVYVATPTGTIYALDATRGSQIWNVHEGSTTLSPAVETAGY
jgi:outer membrane protein assembly factor BamB